MGELDTQTDPYIGLSETAAGALSASVGGLCPPIPERVGRPGSQKKQNTHDDSAVIHPSYREADML